MTGGKIIGDVPQHSVLVTGCPRSGTTFVGSALALPAAVDYLHEPLNPMCGLPAVDERYIDLAADSSGSAVMQLERLLDYEPLLRGAIYARDRGPRRTVKRVIRGRGPLLLTRARLNPWSHHVVIKDPLAACSVGWFADRGFDVVAVLRHPAAVAASFRRLGWSDSSALDALVARPGMATDVERSTLERIRSRSEPRGLELPALLWTIITRKLVDDDRVHVVRHEALSADPPEEFAALRGRLGLPWSRLAERRLERMTSGRRGGLDEGAGHHLRRSSKRVFGEVLSSLNARELASIWAIAGATAERWYRPEGLT